MITAQAQQILFYHEATKHHLHRYAKSLGYLDWANQPNPFRSYEGCTQVRLPIGNSDPTVSYEDVYRRKAVASLAPSWERIGQFLALSMGLSAWKAIGRDKWALRMNPSSGNLHPTELHLVLPAMPGLKRCRV